MYIYGVCVDERLASGTVSYEALTLIFERTSLTVAGGSSTHEVRLGGQRIPGICLSLPPQGWG